MRVENQTSDPVEYEQTGGDPLPEDGEQCVHKGTLNPGEKKTIPDPCGPRFDVQFSTTATKVPKVTVRIEGIQNKDAVVVLSALPVIVQEP